MSPLAPKPCSPLTQETGARGGGAGRLVSCFRGPQESPVGLESRAQAAGSPVAPRTHSRLASTPTPALGVTAVPSLHGPPDVPLLWKAEATPTRVRGRASGPWLPHLD